MKAQGIGMNGIRRKFLRGISWILKYGDNVSY